MTGRSPRRPLTEYYYTGSASYLLFFKSSPFNKNHPSRGVRRIGAFVSRMFFSFDRISDHNHP